MSQTNYAKIFVDSDGRITKTEDDSFIVSGSSNVSSIGVYLDSTDFDNASGIVGYASFKRADGMTFTNRPLTYTAIENIDNKNYFVYLFTFTNTDRILDIAGSLEVSFILKSTTQTIAVATTTLLIRRTVKAPNVITESTGGVDTDQVYDLVNGIVEPVEQKINGHLQDFENPHEVRADQVSLDDEDPTKISVLIKNLQQTVGTIETDLDGLDNKVEKTDTDGVYAHKNGEDIIIPTSSGSDANALVKTNEEGKFFVNDPSLDRHPTPKSYVDTKITEANTYTDEKAAKAETQANEYTDTEITKVNTSVEGKFTQLETNLPNKIKEHAVAKGFSVNYANKSTVEGTDKIVIEDSNNATKYTRLQELIDKIKGEVASEQEKQLILVYETQADLLSALDVSYDSETGTNTLNSITSTNGTVYSGDNLKLGTTIYIKATNVPDYWLATKELIGEQMTRADYIEFFEAIQGSGTGEGESANLDNYYNKDQINALITDFATEEQITFTKSLGTTQALGGIAKGTNLSGKTSKEILDLLLFPYVAFNVSMSTTAAGGTKEVGTSYTVSTATVNITMGSADISSITIKNKAGTTLATKTSGISAGSNTITLPTAQTVTTNETFTAYVVDTHGTTKSANATAFTFVYPYYYGAIDNGATLTEALVKGLTKSVSNKGNKTVTINMTQQNALFAYPKSYGEIKKIFDGNNFDVTETFVKSELAMYDTTYYVYVLSQPATASMEYKFNYS